jgi:hypothetical protein
MDKELFKQKLSEVAEWQTPKICASDIKIAGQKIRGKFKKSEEELEQEMEDPIFQEVQNGVNPTLPPQILVVQKKMQPCDRCGLMQPGGGHIEMKFNTSGANCKGHWRERCLTCEKSKDPYTGEFCLTGTEASIKWNSYLREVNRRNGLKPRQATTNTDTGVIIYYGRDTPKE